MEEPAAHFGDPDFDEWVGSLRDRAGEVYRLLAEHGVRVFAISLRAGKPSKIWYWVHDSKTAAAWRQDVRDFIAASEIGDDDPRGGHAENGVFNALSAHLHALGYAEVDDVVADVFEGRVTNERARLIHDPAHEEQPDGFGHYGWENGRGSKTE